MIRAGGTVVVPSRQRAHAIRLGYSAAQLAAGRRVWASPDVLPLEAWLTREVEALAATRHSDAPLPRLLSPAEEWLLWRQATAEATGDLELINRAALADTLRRADALATEFDIDLNRLRDLPGTESELLRNVRNAVHERYHALAAAPLATLAEEVLVPQEGLPVAFAGFLKPSPRLRRILAARANRGEEEGTAGATPRVVTAADDREELERIADWCRRQVEGRPDARLLVILPGSPGARERLATLIQQVLDPRGWLGDTQSDGNVLVVTEGGAPLIQRPSVAHALSTLAWLTGRRAEFEELSAWLRAPYWSTPDATARVRLDLVLRERGKMSFDLRELSRVLSSENTGAALDLARQIAAAQTPLNASSGTPREWSERFREALQALEWPGNRTRNSGEQQTVVRFHELLDELGQLASAVRSLSRDNAVQWLTELASRTAFRPADDDAVVTISPLLVDPVVQYDGIWVAGLHADVLPQPVQPDPFVPLKAQVSAGVPAATAAGRLQEARALVQAWRAAAAGELVLSSPAHAQDLELLPSPLLAEWAPDPHPAARPVWLPLRMHRDGVLETFEDVSGEPWPLSRPLPSGTRSLELQNQCPFRAYAELRLGSGELGAPEPGVAPDERGQLLHAALQRLWTQLGDSRALSGQPPGALERLIEQCVAEAADSILGQSSGADRPPALARECRRAVRLISRLCDLERERAPFRVEATELNTELTLAGAGLRMRIDRLDALPGGGRAILDYKSGRRSTADWYGERPSHPQLLAYLAAVGSDVVAMATVNVTAREVRFDGVAASADLLPKVRAVEGPQGEASQEAWDLRQREWRDRIEGLARDFIAGRAVVDPKPGACDYCHAISVCRISDVRPAGTETDAEPDSGPGM